MSLELQVQSNRIERRGRPSLGNPACNKADAGSLYIVKQYASDAARREIQLLSLADRLNKVRLYRQAQGNRFPFQNENVRTVSKYPNPTGLLRLIGLGRFRQFLDGLYFPSTTILFVKALVRTLKNEIRADLRNGKPVCLITAVPPHDLVVAGLSLKETFPGLRWVVDWQDLWSFDEYYFGPHSPRRKRQIRELESRALRICDMNVVTNDRAKAVLVRNYGVSPKRVRAIPHAFESSTDVLQTHAASTTGFVNHQHITIGFLGNLLKPPKVPGDRVLAALADVRARGLDIAFHIIGDKYLEQVSRAKIDGLDWAILHPRTTHDEALRGVAECDFLLLCLADSPNTRATLHGKLPYYLALGKPILALVPRDSAVADVIQETGSGFVIGTDEDWGGRLFEIVNPNRLDRLEVRRDEAAIHRYSWHTIKEQWIDVISGAWQACGQRQLEPAIQKRCGSRSRSCR